MLFGLLACKQQVSTLSDHYYSKGDKLYFIPGGNAFERGSRAMDADIASFAVIEGLYARDTSNIFYQGCPQPMVDLATFRLKNKVPMDKNHVYYSNNLVGVSATCAKQQLTVIPEADPESYEKIDESEGYWAKDKAHYFYLNVPVEVDYQTFSIRSPYFAEDSARAYVIASKSLLPLTYRFAKATLLTEHYLLLDRNRLLYYERDRQIGLREMEIFPAKDVEVLHPSTLRVDAQIIYKGRPFGAANVDYKTFEVLEKSSPLHFWAKDAVHVFHNEMQLPDADPSTFEVLHYAVAKDAQHVYVGDSILNDVDAPSFQKAPKTEGLNYDFIDKNGNKYRYRVLDKKPSLIKLP